MKNARNELELGEVPGKGRSSRLAMRIRRAAQMASRAKARTVKDPKVLLSFPGSAEGGSEEPQGGDRPKTREKSASPRSGDAPATPKPPRAPSVGTASVFHRYLRSLHAAEVLPSEEEKRLALLYQANRDQDAAGRLVRGNLRLVVKIAEEYSRNEDQLMDLIQEGNLGLLHALEKFDPNRGVKLSSYAAWWVRAYILRFVLGNFRIVRLGTTLAQRKLFYRLRRERERLERKGVEADVNQLADALQVRPSDVSEMELRLASPEVSLDATPRNDRPHAASNVVPADPGVRPDLQLEKSEFHRRLKDFVERFSEGLSGRERQIFSDRLISDHPLTLRELGRRYGVSRERARQLESRLKEKIRVYLETEFADAGVLEEAA
jgi:RNA polymerase sigma-32 factor